MFLRFVAKTSTALVILLLFKDKDIYDISFILKVKSIMSHEGQKEIPGLDEAEKEMDVVQPIPENFNLEQGIILKTDDSETNNDSFEGNEEIKETDGLKEKYIVSLGLETISADQSPKEGGEGQVLMKSVSSKKTNKPKTPVITLTMTTRSAKKKKAASDKKNVNSKEKKQKDINKKKKAKISENYKVKAEKPEGEAKDVKKEVDDDEKKEVNDEKYLCTLLCGEIFNTYNEMKEHRKTHNTDKNFLCAVCGKCKIQFFILCLRNLELWTEECQGVGTKLKSLLKTDMLKAVSDV